MLESLPRVCKALAQSQVLAQREGERREGERERRGGWIDRETDKGEKREVDRQIDRETETEIYNPSIIPGQ